MERADEEVHHDAPLRLLMELRDQGKARQDNVWNYIPSIVIDGNLVETVECAKLFGVTLSNDLTWNRHVESIVKRATKSVYYVISVKKSKH